MVKPIICSCQRVNLRTSPIRGRGCRTGTRKKRISTNEEEEVSMMRNYRSHAIFGPISTLSLFSYILLLRVNDSKPSVVSSTSIFNHSKGQQCIYYLISSHRKSCTVNFSFKFTHDTYFFDASFVCCCFCSRKFLIGTDYRPQESSPQSQNLRICNLLPCYF